MRGSLNRHRTNIQPQIAGREKQAIATALRVIPGG